MGVAEPSVTMGDVASNPVALLAAAAAGSYLLFRYLRYGMALMRRNAEDKVRVLTDRQNTRCTLIVQRDRLLFPLEGVIAEVTPKGITVDRHAKSSFVPLGQVMGVRDASGELIADWASGRSWADQPELETLGEGMRRTVSLTAWKQQWTSIPRRRVVSTTFIAIVSVFAVVVWRGMPYRGFAVAYAVLVSAMAVGGWLFSGRNG